MANGGSWFMLSGRGFGLGVEVDARWKTLMEGGQIGHPAEFSIPKSIYFSMYVGMHNTLWSSPQTKPDQNNMQIILYYTTITRIQISLDNSL